jgi:hypothetical protein
MKSFDDSLSESLRELAAASPQGAAPEVGVRLQETFARHHARRRSRTIALASAAIVCIAMTCGWLWIAKHPGEGVTVTKTSPGSTVAPVPARVAESPKIDRPIAERETNARVRSVVDPRNRHVAKGPVAAASNFVALPSFDPDIPIGESRMVRLELPGSALQLIGYPASEELLDRRVLTDVLVGQDGVPYAVRLVQTQAVH